jgi:hypothetical protein
MGAESGKELTYQWQLRALGALLDEEPNCRISVAEMPDGFLVRMQRALHKLEPHVVHFKHEMLVQQLEQLLEQRKVTGKARHQGIWASFPNGHQDFFRALGYELDEASARNILIDELEDGIVVTYSYPDSSNGQAWKRRMVVLKLEDIEAVLNAAFERRKKQPQPQPEPQSQQPA